MLAWVVMGGGESGFWVWLLGVVFLVWKGDGELYGFCREMLGLDRYIRRRWIVLF